jgi:hypothetical protein
MNRKRKYQNEPLLDPAMYDRTTVTARPRLNELVSTTVLVQRQSQPQQQQPNSQLPSPNQINNNGSFSENNDNGSDGMDAQETQKTPSEKVAEEWNMILPSLVHSNLNYLGSIKDATPDPRDITITSSYGCHCIPDEREMAINEEGEESNDEEDEEGRRVVLVYFMHRKHMLK